MTEICGFVLDPVMCIENKRNKEQTGGNFGQQSHWPFNVTKTELGVAQH